MRDVEITGRSVEEAVELALEKLGVTREEVYVDVLESGRRGLLGIGQGQARVRVRLLREGEEGGDGESELDEHDVFAAGEQEIDADIEASETEESRPPEIEIESFDDLADYAAEVLENVLQRMHVPGTVEIVEPEETSADEAEQTVYLDIVGPEAGVLIGRRAETLNSLQFMVNLIVSKKTGKRTRIVVDAEGYRIRREESLQKLAQRMAERVLATSEPVVLEAMPANERRIVHLAISGIDGVTTESTGEADQRKVVILPAKPAVKQ